MDVALILGSATAILLLAVIAGLFHPARLSLDGQQCRAAFATAYPDEQVTDLIFDQHRRLALLSLASGRLGLVKAMAGDAACRIFDTSLSWEEDDGRLVFNIDDPGFPAAHFMAKSEDELDQAKSLLSKLKPSITANPYVD